MSSCSGTPSRLIPSSSAVSPQRSSDSVKTIRAFLKVPSSWASCWTVSTMTRLISSASVAGTVENAAVRVTSAIALVSRRRGRAQVIQARLEPTRAHADADRLGEIQRRVRLLARGDVVAEPTERRERLLAHPGVDEELAPFVVQARRLDCRL